MVRLAMAELQEPGPRQPESARDRLLAAAVAIAMQGGIADLSLRELAADFLGGLLQPDVVRLRRLVIAEADRFPEIGRAWFDRGFNRALVILGEAMRRLADRGLLQGLADPALAAYQFAGLVMYQPMNQVMFGGTDALPPADQLNRIADAAVDTFLATYG